MPTKKRIGQWWWDLLKESMKQAEGAEEAIAISKGHYRQGIPAITVIVDGGWSTQSYKHSYNAKSGVGIIIDKETGKILYMGVRNKYCSVCRNTTGDTIPLHDCFLNWDQPWRLTSLFPDFFSLKSNMVSATHASLEMVTAQFIQPLSPGYHIATSLKSWNMPTTL